MAPETPLLHLLAIDLRLEHGARLGFFHDHTLQALLHDRLATASEFPAGTRLWAVESGRVRYGPGAPYRLGLALVAGSRPDATDWARALSLPPQRAFGNAPGAPFGLGTRLVGVTDIVAGRRLPPGQPPQALTLADVSAAARPLVGAVTCTLRFRTPMRILRPPISAKDVVLDGEVFDCERLFDRCLRAVAAAFPGLVDGLWAGDATLDALPVAEVRDNAMFRTDASHVRKRIAASKGCVVIDLRDPLPERWAQVLVLAGVLGVGQAANMGLGRFTIDSAPLHPAWPVPPARTHLEAAARPEVFDAAWDRIARAGKTPGVDEVDRRAFVEALPLRAAALQAQLRTGDVDVAPLRGVLLQRPDGKLRGLAIPTMQDRFLQRCVAEVLEAAIDEQLEESAFAYRRGLCRRSAQAALRRAHDEGYRHVVDGDIRAFFDEVDWERLERRLAAYFDDEALIGLLMRWMRAPVQFGDRSIARDRGLPQGAVLAPYLANFYLDCFDEAMQRRGLRLVRYADDFVVLCRSEAEAEAARAAVEQELAALKLRLASEKTTTTSFEKGFVFLGFLFCRGVVIERPGKARAERIDDDAWRDAVEVTAAEASASGWLAALVGEATAEETGEAAEAMTGWHAPLALGGKERRAVYVVDNAARVSGSRRGVRVYRGKELVAEVAWQHIAEVAIVGGHRVDGSLYQQAMRQRVPVSLYSRYGEALGVAIPERARHPGPLARQQWRWASEGEEAMAVARALVEAKIHNQRLVARRQRGDNEPLRERLREAAQAALRAGGADRLRGIEGGAARDYFAAWRGWVDATWGFAGRTGRGADDPLNAVLNLLYTLLYRRCWLAAVQAGLDPHCGVLHVGHGRYAALAADLQEPFRFLCDRVVLDLVHRHRLHVEQFHRHEKEGFRTRMNEDALRLVLGEWERVLDLEVDVQGERTSYRRHIALQAERLAKVVAGERADVGAFRLKW